MPKKQIYSRSTVDLPMLDVDSLDSLDSLDSVDSDMNFLSLFGGKKGIRTGAELGRCSLSASTELGTSKQITPKVSEGRPSSHC